MGDTNRATTDVVVILDWGWCNGQWIAGVVGVTANAFDALGSTVAIIRAWNRSRPVHNQIVLPADASGTITAYEKATRRRIQFKTTTYYTSPQAAEMALASDTAHDLGEEAGETLTFDSTLDIKSMGD